jgi:hypothetical protein
MTRSRAVVRLSLSQRERIEVRDCSASVSRGPTKWPAERYQVLPGPGDSKSARWRFPVGPEISLLPDRVFHYSGSRGLHHQVRRQASRPDNKNPRCKDRQDAVAEICNGRSFGSEDGAKECVRSRSRSCEDNWGGTLRDCLVGAILSEKGNRLPLTSILSPRPGRGGLQQA